MGVEKIGARRLKPCGILTSPGRTEGPTDCWSLVGLKECNGFPEVWCHGLDSTYLEDAALAGAGQEIHRRTRWKLGGEFHAESSQIGVVVSRVRLRP